MVAAVASGFFQYPAMTLPPRTTISPASPLGRALPFSSQILMSMGTTVRPEEPKRAWPTELAQITGVASVRPYPWKMGIPMAQK